MLNTLQCHQPLPFWASVSTIVSAKLCVPAGSPDQVSAGETFCPLQLPSTCTNAIGLPLLTFVEDTVNFASAGVAAAANTAPNISVRILPSLTTASNVFTSVDASVSARRIFGTVLRVAFDAAVRLPRARMGVRGSGPHHSHALEARCEKLASRPRLSSNARHTLL